MFDDLKDMFLKRWAEMVLIVVFLAIGLFLFEQISNEVSAIQQSTAENGTAITSGTMSQTTSFMFSMGAMIFMILWMTLHLGFLATLKINYATALDPKLLFLIGRRYFWRLVRFQIFMTLFSIAAFIVVLSAAKAIFFPSIPEQSIPVLASATCAIIATSALAKPMLLVPPIMICKNCMVLEAFRIMSDYRILDIKILPAIFICGVTAAAGFSILLMNIEPNTAISNVLIASKGVFAGTMAMVTGCIGIWFIGGNKFGVIEDIPDSEADEQQQAVE